MLPRGIPAPCPLIIIPLPPLDRLSMCALFAPRTQVLACTDAALRALPKELLPLSPTLLVSYDLPTRKVGARQGGGGALPLLCLFETRGTFCDLRTADGTQLRPPVAHVCPTPQGCCCVAHWAPPLAFATCRRGCTSALPSRLCSLRQLAQRALLAAPTRATPGHPRTHLLAVPAPTFPISTPPPPPV